MLLHRPKLKCFANVWQSSRQSVDEHGVSCALFSDLRPREEHGIYRSRQSAFQWLFDRCDRRRCSRERTGQSLRMEMGVHLTLEVHQLLAMNKISGRRRGSHAAGERARESLRQPQRVLGAVGGREAADAGGHHGRDELHGGNDLRCWRVTVRH